MDKNEKRLEEINQRLGKLTSIGYVFLLSIVKGVGTAIGATIVTALIIWVLSFIAQTFNGFLILR
jgi:hypothetical protein